MYIWVTVYLLLTFLITRRIFLSSSVYIHSLLKVKCFILYSPWSSPASQFCRCIFLSNVPPPPLSAGFCWIRLTASSFTHFKIQVLFVLLTAGVSSQPNRMFFIGSCTRLVVPPNRCTSVEFSCLPIEADIFMVSPAYGWCFFRPLNGIFFGWVLPPPPPPPNRRQTGLGRWFLSYTLFLFLILTHCCCW